MTLARTFKLALAGAAALALVACDSETGDGAADLAGEPIAEIPAPEGTSWSETVTVTDRGGFLMGNPEAPIKLLEYGSLTCPGCAAFSAAASEKITNDYVASGRVSFEFRSFLIHGPLDLALTRMISCGPVENAIPLADQVWANLGAIQDRAYSDQAGLEAALQLPEDQRFVVFAERAGLYDFFSARGVSEDQARTCLADWPSLQALADHSQSYSVDDGIRGTPTLLVNGRQLDESSWQSVEATLQRAGAR